MTNLQYASFIEAGGYLRREFWSPEGWQWRETKNRNAPQPLRNDFENPIFPRVGVKPSGEPVLVMQSQLGVRAGPGLRLTREES